MAIEVIQWKEDSGEDMVWRFPDSSEIKMGAQLIVAESQYAVFFRDGKALDVFTAGRHTRDYESKRYGTCVNLLCGF